MLTMSIGANRVLVQSSVYEEFASRLAKKVDKFKVGYGAQSSCDRGPAHTLGYRL